MDQHHHHQHRSDSAHAVPTACSRAGTPGSTIAEEPALHAQHTADDSPARVATAATVHCLTGCAIGEVVGLMIGVSLGLGAWPTMLLATALAYVSGFALGLLPLIRRGMSFAQALRTIWLGEAISIAVMELAMNFTDYHMGGMSAPSVLHPQFWTGFLVALPAGFIAAWPVNWWLLRRRIKRPCH
jgi:hypothetical protein